MQLHVDEIHVDNRLAIAITSMARVGNKIYLGLTAGQDCLAAYDVESGKISMQPAIFPWIKDRGYCTKIHNALGVMNDGSLLIGEGNHFTWDGIPVTVQYLDKELPESMLERKRSQGFPDVKYTDFCLANLKNWSRLRDNPGGKIVRFDPKTQVSKVVVSLPPYLYVQSMIVDSTRNRAFGHTIPDNHFFYFDLNSGKLQDYGRISDYAFHNLVVAPNGLCYGAWLDKATDKVKLFRFNPETETMHYLDKIILDNIGPKVAGNQGIDQWIVTRDGNIFVGTVAEACLLKFDWQNETFTMIIPKLSEARVTSLDEDENGIIWIGTGYPHMQLISFNPRSNLVTNYGRVNNQYSRCYFHGACYMDGKLYLGETDGFSPSLHIVELK